MTATDVRLLQLSTETDRSKNLGLRTGCAGGASSAQQPLAQPLIHIPKLHVCVCVRLSMCVCVYPRCTYVEVSFWESLPSFMWVLWLELRSGSVASVFTGSALLPPPSSFFIDNINLLLAF